jgi:hypothetical protein
MAIIGPSGSDYLQIISRPSAQFLGSGCGFFSPAWRYARPGAHFAAFGPVYFLGRQVLCDLEISPAMYKIFGLVSCYITFVRYVWNST